jgi:hypothetical protein
LDLSSLIFVAIIIIRNYYSKQLMIRDEQIDTALKWEPQQSLAAKYEKDQCVSGKIRMEKLPTLSKEWKRIPPTDHLNIQGRSTHIQNQKILQSEI